MQSIKSPNAHFVELIFDETATFLNPILILMLVHPLLMLCLHYAKAKEGWANFNALLNSWVNKTGLSCEFEPTKSKDCWDPEINARLGWGRFLSECLSLSDS